MAAKFRISYNAPVVLTFAVLAVIVQITTEYISPSLKQWFAAWPEFRGLPSYLGLVTHILGHANWDHLLGNFTMILLIGPILEERHGSKSLFAMIVITALVTGLIQVTFGSEFLVGASGIVFMMILLASMANIRQHEIPLTFIAVAVLFLGREVVAMFESDQVSQMAHLIGGIVGAGFGFLSAEPKRPGALDKAGLKAVTKPATAKPVVR